MQRLSISAAITILALTVAVSAYAFDPKSFELKDPAGDDKGPGNYSYPTGSEYARGSFDLRSVSVKDKGSSYEFRVKLGARVKDPWNSKSWGGNGFSLQMVQIYINSKRGGFRGTLPGINVKFPKGHAWDKVVFISPQPKSKIVSEVKSKEKKMLRGLVVPTRTYASGRELIATVKKAALGRINKSWGFQAVMQSNEGYAKRDSVLARKVNEYAGQHRFGGGNDHNCDPHAIDILAAPARGGSDEKQAQYKALKAFTCTASGKGKKAVIPMIYPGK